MRIPGAVCFYASAPASTLACWSPQSASWQQLKCTATHVAGAMTEVRAVHNYVLSFCLHTCTGQPRSFPSFRAFTRTPVVSSAPLYRFSEPTPTLADRLLPLCCQSMYCRQTAQYLSAVVMTERVSQLSLIRSRLADVAKPALSERCGGSTTFIALEGLQEHG